MSVPDICENGCSAEDYWNLPDGEHAELIDGVLYAMTPPGRLHQRISMELAYRLRRHIDEYAGTCQVYAAPFAVKLNADDRTWVEPDISVVCDSSKLTERGCEGAPDLVVEIVSPSSQRIDYLIKANAYEMAGVREYWIIDPQVSQTVAYRFGDDAVRLKTYGFEEPVPVGIWHNACQVVLRDLL